MMCFVLLLFCCVMRVRAIETMYTCHYVCECVDACTIRQLFIRILLHMISTHLTHISFSFQRIYFIQREPYSALEFYHNHHKTSFFFHVEVLSSLLKFLKVIILTQKNARIIHSYIPYIQSMLDFRFNEMLCCSPLAKNINSSEEKRLIETDMHTASIAHILDFLNYSHNLAFWFPILLLLVYKWSFPHLSQLISIPINFHSRFINAKKRVNSPQ